MNRADEIGSVLSFVALGLSLLLLAAVKLIERSRERVRVARMLDFTETGRSSHSRSRKDSEDSYLNLLSQNILGKDAQ